MHTHLAGPGFRHRLLTNLQDLARRSLLHIKCSLHLTLQSDQRRKHNCPTFTSTPPPPTTSFANAGWRLENTISWWRRRHEAARIAASAVDHCRQEGG